MFTVKDVKTKLFAAPFFQKNAATAIRSFSTACEDTNTDLNKYPEDFSLYEVGSFDPETGQIHSEIPNQIANASDFVIKNQ